MKLCEIGHRKLELMVITEHRNRGLSRSGNFLSRCRATPGVVEVAMPAANHSTRQITWIPVGTLLSGQDISLAVHRLVGTQPGPSLGLVGGVHGDEPLSVELVRRVLGALEALPLRGSVTAIPCANPLAFQSLLRNT